MLYNSLSLIAGMLYIAVGVFVIITKSFSVELDPMIANILGGLLCLYGVFRIVRAIIRLKRKNNDE
ncbi:MAG: C4-dicarboxylate ABC transporter [Flavobacteriaceae bacterium]|nr:C4-dicarboxylate ABC transporter [Flavobacteriaceae bacterium]